MAPSENDSHSSSNRNGEVVGRPVNVLASCYAVDSSAMIQGFHYTTTGAGGTFPCAVPLSHTHILTYLQGHSGIPEALEKPWESPPSSPPLAALTNANELALLRSSKTKQRIDGRSSSRKGGAARHIREECERLFCETMKTVFFGEERHAGSSFSIAMGANGAYPSPDESMDSYHDYFDNRGNGHGVDAWLEIWDYAGGTSFRGFVGGKGDKKSLFAFFDPSVIDSDLKQGLMALIELAEAVFAVSQVVICLDRAVPEANAKAFMKSLRWVGFDLITLGMWAGDMDTTSDKWLLLGMEV